VVLFFVPCTQLRSPSTDSCRSQRVFGISFAISRSRDLPRRLFREHAPDHTRWQVAELVVEHLERSNIEFDEEGKSAPPTAARKAAPATRRALTSVSGEQSGTLLP
jgi:hypothetical protein